MHFWKSVWLLGIHDLLLLVLLLLWSLRKRKIKLGVLSCGELELKSRFSSKVSWPNKTFSCAKLASLLCLNQL